MKQAVCVAALEATTARWCHPHPRWCCCPHHRHGPRPHHRHGPRQTRCSSSPQRRAAQWLALAVLHQHLRSQTCLGQSFGQTRAVEARGQVQVQAQPPKKTMLLRWQTNSLVQHLVQLEGCPLVHTSTLCQARYVLQPYPQQQQQQLQHLRLPEGRRLHPSMRLVTAERCLLL